ncbi:glycoside hydrolase family 13 protein [Pisolithus microcarpus]|nr:glycoside hydrolase family 13 protein [Pisolithus microcarpus]
MTNPTDPVVDSPGKPSLTLRILLSERSEGEAPIRVYEFKLGADGGPSKEGSVLYRLPPAYTPYILRVSLDAGTPASKNGDRFTERSLPTDLSKPIRVDLPISHAGAFVYWVEYDGDAPGERIKGREGYFNVDPILRVRARTSVLSSDLRPLLPSEGVVSKWMGPISQWKAHFQEASDRGYTMLHWTPLQERGSKKYDLSVFDTPVNPQTASTRMEKILRIAKEEYGLLNLTDVVLNHTANNSPWLAEHPEAGYSPSNTPHLSPALELDTAILEFSSSLSGKGLPTRVSCQQDIDTLMTAFADHLKTKQLWQYYVLNAEEEKAALTDAFLSNTIIPWTGEDLAGKTVVELANIVRGGTLASRFVTRVDGGVSAGFIKAAFPKLGNDVDALAQAWARVVDVLNVPLYAEWEEDTKIALDNIKNRSKYTRLDDNGPKLGEITKNSPLVEPYFTRIAPQWRSDPETYSLANNGWLWNADPLVNFALPPSKAYLRREVIVWGDCVKLRYGSGPSDNPWIWEHMTSYVTYSAQTFDGFRIDNCHSTPLHVGTAMLDTARKVNPDLYVCAELFTGSEEMDLLFVRKLGVNSLIREAGNAWDVQEFSRIMHLFGLGKPIGSMDEACTTNMEELAPPFGKGPTRPCIVSPLNGSTPHALLYDLTHDNESYLDKRTAEHALAVAGIVTFGYCFDDLYPKLLRLVEEKRQYGVTGLSENSGISRAKRVLNSLHREMVIGGYTEGCVWRDSNYIHAYVLVAHTAFEKRGKERGPFKPSELARTRAKFICGFAIDILSHEVPDDPDLLRGLSARLIDLPEVPYFPPRVDLELDRFCKSDVESAFGGLDLEDLNVVLHRADNEERDITGGKFGVYDVPGAGQLHITRRNDLGHPLCDNLRRGTWALDYVVSRGYQMDDFPNLAAPVQWLLDRFDRVKSNAPAYLRPKFFAIVMTEAYKAARRAVIEQCSEFVSDGHDFTHSLAIAGLPHFSAGWARCWGRDVKTWSDSELVRFWKESSVCPSPKLKVLDLNSSPRYNSRDSPWWMLQNIQDYVKMAPNGISILSEFVPRSTLAEIMQEILQRHASGISFREYNAGPNLDQQMKDNGFNIDIYVDWDTGLVFGGMLIIMGESVRAGTKGVPGTPRDGAPIEITGLVKSTVRWLDELSRKGKFPTVVYGEDRFKSFEKHYYIPLGPKYILNMNLVNCRGIYKDVYGSGAGREWSDYQFRPDYPIAMVVAPEMFDEHHALHALRLADTYRPDYDNSNDSDDPSVAKGLNYHNGPEWGWPLGYFCVLGEGKDDPTTTLHRLHRALLQPRNHIQTDAWAGLPDASTMLDFLEDVHEYASHECTA